MLSLAGNTQLTHQILLDVAETGVIMSSRTIWWQLRVQFSCGHEHLLCILFPPAIIQGVSQIVVGLGVASVILEVPLVGMNALVQSIIAGTPRRQLLSLLLWGGVHGECIGWDARGVGCIGWGAWGWVHGRWGAWGAPDVVQGCVVNGV